MKTRVYIILLLMIGVAYAADTELQDLAENTTIATTDVLYLVDNPGAAPASEKITALNLFDMIDTSAELYGILTDETGSGGGTPLAVFNFNPTLTGFALAADADAGNFDLDSLDRLEFFDAGLYIDGGTDAVMDITSDGTLELHSADWDIGATGIMTGIGNITSDGTLVIVAVDGSGTISGILFTPDAADGADIGTVDLEFSDIYLAASSVIYGENDQSNSITSSATAWTFLLDVAISGADLTLGVNADVDPTITFDGDTSDGVLNYDEDNADFEFDQDIIITGGLNTDGVIVLGDGGDNFSVASDGIDIATNGNITNAGTIGSGAITSTGAVVGTSLVAGSTTGDGTVVIHDDDGGGDATVTIQAVDATGASYTLTLPPDDGDNTQVMQTNGAGLLTWVANAGGGTMSSFFAEDGDGTEVEITDQDEWKFIDGTGMTIDWTDTDGGGDGDPFDLTFATTLGVSIAAAEMADEDHGDMTWSGGSGTVQFIEMFDSATSTYYVSMSDTDGAGASAALYTDTEFTYTEATGTLTVTAVASDLTGAVTGAASGNLLNSESDTLIGTLTADGLTLGQDENITLAGQTLDHDGTDFVFNDSVNTGGNAIRTTVNIKDEPKPWIFNIFDPLAVQTLDTQVCIVNLTSAALTITNIKITLDAAGNEIAGDLKYADTFIGLANPVVINICDTTNGVLDDSAMGTAAVPSGKCVYYEFDSAPHTDITQMGWNIIWDYD